MIKNCLIFSLLLFAALSVSAQRYDFSGAVSYCGKTDKNGKGHITIEPDDCMGKLQLVVEIEYNDNVWHGKHTFKADPMNDNYMCHYALASSDSIPVEDVYVIKHIETHQTIFGDVTIFGDKVKPDITYELQVFLRDDYAGKVIEMVYHENGEPIISIDIPYTKRDYDAIYGSIRQVQKAGLLRPGYLCDFSCGLMESDKKFGASDLNGFLSVEYDYNCRDMLKLEINQGYDDEKEVILSYKNETDKGNRYRWETNKQIGNQMVENYVLIGPETANGKVDTSDSIEIYTTNEETGQYIYIKVTGTVYSFYLSYDEDFYVVLKEAIRRGILKEES